MGEFAIGQGVSRFEDPRLIQGGGRYTDDVKLPGMAHGVVLRSPHAHAKIKSINIAAAKAAPGVLCVLTSADIKAAGFPRSAGARRAQTARRFAAIQATLSDPGRNARTLGRRLRRLCRRRDHRAGDGCRRTDPVDYEPLPAVTSTAEAPKPGSAARLGRLRRQYRLRRVDRRQGRDRCGLRARRARRQASLRDQPRHRRFHGAARRGRRLSRGRGRYTLYTALQRPHPVRADLAKLLNVSESKVRIVTGDTGGSFGMKSPIFNEMPLVLLASKLTGRPVKWISTRSEAFLSDAQGRDNVTEAELALDKDGTFLALRVKTVAAIGAYLQANMPAFRLQCRNARRHLPHAGDPRRHHRRVHQHQSGTALSRQWPARGRLTSSSAWSMSPPTN